MASPSPVHTPLTLEEFLELPEIDEHPYLEYVDGRIEAKVSPQKKDSSIQGSLLRRLDDFAEKQERGESFPELRCTFSGRSIVPDVVFLLSEHIETDSEGEYIDETFRPPDLHIEIGSPHQPLKRNRDRLLFSTSNGCLLGWFIDPERRIVEVYRPGQAPERLPDDGVILAEPVLPGFRLPVRELFGWLKPRHSGPSRLDEAEPGEGAP